MVVPAYNNVCELSRSLSALRNAADADSELIVVDDGSSQDVSSTAARWGARVLRLAGDFEEALAALQLLHERGTAYKNSLPKMYTQHELKTGIAQWPT